MGSKITLDAHSLVWYMDEGLRDRLSSAALEAVREAEKRATIYVPAIILMEIVYLIEKGKVNTSFSVLMSYIERSGSYQIVPIDADLLKVAIPLKGLEIHDRLILATAILTNSVLVSKDRDISAKGVEVVW
jgi:PIN domain nuclease of toxin-antitoxin system